MLLSVRVTASVRCIVPWTIIEVSEHEYSLEKLFKRGVFTRFYSGFFNTIQAGCFYSVTVFDDLKSAKLQQSFVGSKADALMVTSNAVWEVYK